jgi:hypothetical protein
MLEHVLCHIAIVRGWYSVFGLYMA